MQVNFDGIVGPTHNYGGLSRGNLASEQHGGSASNPKEAALEGLRKMKFVRDLGLAQGVLPPQERPFIGALRALGYGGADAALLEQVAREDPLLLRLVSSASSMWAANCATVAPSCDTQDGRVHITPANLFTTFHRSLEVPSTVRALRRLFPSGSKFQYHTPLPRVEMFADEGAANHVRLGPSGQPGLHLFVYGRGGGNPGIRGPQRFPARQAFQASAALSRLHRLAPDSVQLLQQSAKAIDAGVFHNDVIAVGTGTTLLMHEEAFDSSQDVPACLHRRMPELSIITVNNDELSLPDAVRSYLFNSQLLTLANGNLTLIAPQEVRELPAAQAVVERLIDGSSAIDSVHFLDVRQSMHNGGGPACLRFALELTPDELRAVHPPALLTDDLYTGLTQWVERHYRDQLHPQDLADPRLLDESRRALDELSQLLELGSDFYPFQRSALDADHSDAAGEDLA